MTRYKIYFSGIILVIAAGVIVLSRSAQDIAKGENMDAESSTKFSNRLAGEKSPYLRQHAHNPVDWYPWGPEAFEKARREDKPIFLSIGYSTCHWCHVMAHESFEDETVAQLMNEAFISIKVDREERPDIDNVYMLACQLLTGSGGWPLTIIMTPDKKPFFAGTYIPKETRFGRMGMIELIPRVQEGWRTARAELLQSSDSIVDALREASAGAPGTQDISGEMIQSAFRQLSERFDERNGGFGSAPKFPSPHTLSFLLRHWKRSGDDHALNMVESTLKSMRRGGIYDQVGFGFHRYATDAQWLVPHFEKMLYDQAMLVLAYTEAYQATGNEEYADTARQIVTYVLRDMTAPEGGFYSAEDADSEGREGKFYLWTHDEIGEALEDDEALLFRKVFSVEKNGNFLEEATGTGTDENILHLTLSWDELAAEFDLTVPGLRDKLEKVRNKLFAHRESRIHPHKDDKILTDWNGLMIAALAKASRILDEPLYADAAQKAADFILAANRDSKGRLLHRYHSGQSAIRGNLDDYAFLVWGLTEMYETTHDVRYLELAVELTDDTIKYFLDENDGGFYFTATDNEELLVRQKESYDGALPSGNSVTMLNLLKLGRLTNNADYEKIAASIGRAFSAQITQSPSGFTSMMSAAGFGLGPSFELIIVGDHDAPDTQKMIQALRQQFIPNMVVILRPTVTDTDATGLLGFTSQYSSIDGKATAYVCQDYVCKRPTTDIDAMLRLLGVE